MKYRQQPISSSYLAVAGCNFSELDSAEDEQALLYALWVRVVPDAGRGSKRRQGAPEDASTSSCGRRRLLKSIARQP